MVSSVSTTTTPDSDPVIRHRLDYVDALRAISCLAVIFHHCIGFHAPPSGVVHHHLVFRVAEYISNLGWLGVNMFLVLSGFCLYYPLVRKNPVARIKLNVREFAKRRAWRILPPYYAAIVLCLGFVLLQHWHEHHAHWYHVIGKKDFLLHVLMLHNLVRTTYNGINPPFWSLALESQLYLIFPVIAMVAAKRGFKWAIAATLLISVVWQMYAYHRFGFVVKYSNIASVVYNALPGRCFEFAVGMFVASLVARPAKNQYVIAACILAVLLVPGIKYAEWCFGFGPFVDQIWAVICGCVLILGSMISDTKMESNPVLNGLTKIGTFSYSIYLIHAPLLMYIFGKLDRHFNYKTSAVIGTILTYICAIGLGYVFHRLFERPFMRGFQKASPRGPMSPGTPVETTPSVQPVSTSAV